MNKRKIKKQIKLGNTYMSKPVGNGRGNFEVNMTIISQLNRFKHSKLNPRINPIKWKNKPKYIKSIPKKRPLHRSLITTYYEKQGRNTHRIRKAVNGLIDIVRNK